jgi:recombination protein RecA
MKSAALEAVLSEFSTLVVPASQLQRPAVPMVPCGIDAVDALTGGLPRGSLTEICGPASSGRTTLLFAALAEATTRGEVCALVDASDCFDPLSAQQAGVELDRVLWVRCNEQQSAFSNRHSAKANTGTTRIADQQIAAAGSKGEQRHKQRETRFINSGMKNCGSRGVHTQLYSGMPEIPEINVLTRPEQRYRDISKLKQGDYSEPGRIPPKSEHSALSIQHSANENPRTNHGFARIRTNPKSEIGNQKSEIENLLATWNLEPGRRLSAAGRAELSRVEQALKVTDLLLQSGGFGLIAVDLGNISVRSARRVQLTSWFRFRRAVENTATVLLVLEREAHARSCASLVLELAARKHSAISSQHSAKPLPPRRHGDTERSISEFRIPISDFKPAPGSTADVGMAGSPDLHNEEDRWQSGKRPSHAELLTGLGTRAEIARGERKGVASVHAEFRSESPWSA